MPKVAMGIGELLVHQGHLRREDLDEALLEQRRTRERLGELLLRRGLISPEDLLDALGYQLGYRRFDATHDAVDPAVLELIPLEIARRHSILPVRASKTSLVVAVADPLDVEAMDRLRQIAARSNHDLEILLAPRGEIEKLRESSYRPLEGVKSVHELIDSVVDEMETAVVEEEPDAEAAERRAQQAGIVRLVDQVIAQALEERATDIHIEPQENSLVIRYRVDGLLHDALRPPRAVYMGVNTRVKILASMDIAERRAAQDGRFSYKPKGREVDVRVSCVPTIHGEKIVMRLLDKTGFNFSIDHLGFNERDHKLVQSAIRQPYGMILLSGPTGSGKTTTLYSCLLALRDETLNILTIEDPVEYQIERINQVQVNERKEVTFATALRSFLRQDPDVIMVGEIRDSATADIAVRAALTGHMVFSTIHANDAPSTAVRLCSMGIEPFMAAGALTLVAAQRLVRRICPQCPAPYRPPEEVLVALGIGSASAREDAHLSFQRGEGCSYCRGRGYQGRLAIIELMRITPQLRQLIAERRPAHEIRRQALADGMTTLRDSGLEKARDGLTTAEEVLRVCSSDE